MMKRWVEYVSIFGILLCVGLFLYNMTEMNKLSMQYNQIQDSLQQLLDDKKANIAQNELEIFKDSFFKADSALSVGWYAEYPLQEVVPSEESSVGYYSLEKTEYLENVLYDNPTSDSYSEKSTEILIPSYWEWEWEGPTIPAEEAAQYGLVKYSYLME